MKPKNYLFLLATIVLASCQTESIPLARHGRQVIDIASFTSREDVVNAICNNDIATKSDEEDGPDCDLFTGVEDLDYEDDPILSIDFQRIDDTRLIEDDDLTVYEALGYDELIPNRSFARIMNARAEVMVCDTIYKISPKGTYFFPSSCLEEFEQNYQYYENEEGTMVSERLFRLSPNVYRYSTFDHDEYDELLEVEDVDEDEEVDDDDEGGDEVDDEVTKAPYLTWANTINWRAYPRENISAHTVVGKLLERFFGRSQYYYYYYSNRERFAARFYYYDYIVYAESGMSAETERRPFLFWLSPIYAQNICVGCRNVIYEMTIPASVPSIPKIDLVSYTYEKVPMAGVNGKVFYIFGWNFSYSQLMNLLSSRSENIFDKIKKITGQDVSDAKAFKFFVDSKVVIYVPYHYIEGKNTNRLIHTFYEQTAFGIKDVDIFNMHMPSSLEEWIGALCKVCAGTYSVAKFRLKEGEVQAAAKHNGQIKAVTLYKHNN